MVKIFLLTLLVIGFINHGNCAVGVISPQNKPEKFVYTPGCYMRDFDIVIPYNESLYPINGRECAKYVCNYDGYVHVYSCVTLFAGRNCRRLNGNLSLSYPSCCDRIDCSKKPIKRAPMKQTTQISDTKLNEQIKAGNATRQTQIVVKRPMVMEVVNKSSNIKSEENVTSKEVINNAKIHKNATIVNPRIDVTKPQSRNSTNKVIVEKKPVNISIPNVLNNKSHDKDDDVKVTRKPIKREPEAIKDSKTSEPIESQKDMVINKTQARTTNKGPSPNSTFVNKPNKVLTPDSTQSPQNITRTRTHVVNKSPDSFPNNLPLVKNTTVPAAMVDESQKTLTKNQTMVKNITSPLTLHQNVTSKVVSASNGTVFKNRLRSKNETKVIESNKLPKFKIVKKANVTNAKSGNQPFPRKTNTSRATLGPTAVAITNSTESTATRKTTRNKSNRRRTSSQTARASRK